MEENIMSAVKILLVDDEKPFVETMMKRLKKRDIEVKPAYDGVEALRLSGTKQWYRGGHSGH
jgi:ActR/RegA family two-component response regulator